MTARRISAVLSGAALMGALSQRRPPYADRYEEADPAGDMAIFRNGSAISAGRRTATWTSAT